MSGIYFHIPFCKQACHYCNFHFSTSLLYKSEMLAAIRKEITLASAGITEAVETIYFGGGTPSLLSTDEISVLLGTTKEVYTVDDNAEITLEANPDDISEIKLMHWRQAGINRLSIGIQSFEQDDLLWMNRAHNADQALRCLQMVTSSGFSNYSVDLIYGTPTLSDHQWILNVKKLIAFKVPHISCYALTVEPATALQKMILQKKRQEVDAEKQADQFLLLTDLLGAAGYEHYEISNFALPGFRSKHNSSYWQGKPYLGFGPSAHSYLGEVRRWNISNNALYMKTLVTDTLPFEQEHLSVTDRLNEYIMTSLRTIEGLDLNVVQSNFAEEMSALLLLKSREFQQNGRLVHLDNRLVLSREGKLFADGIAASLFFEAGESGKKIRMVNSTR